MRQIGIIIGREFKERVMKKSFILTTIFMPLLFLGLSIAPTLIMKYAGSEKRTISVIDESGEILPLLKSNDDVEFTPSNNSLADELKASLENDIFGVLFIGENIIADPNNVQLYTNTSSSMTLEQNISSQIERIIEDIRLARMDKADIRDVLKQVSATVKLTTFRNDKEEENTASSAMASSVVGMVLGFILYFFLVIYGSMVMQSVIEEKSSRVLDVLVSTVKPFDLMMGKILGIASVAATQVLIWGVLILGISALVVPMFMSADMSEAIKATQSGMDIAATMSPESNLDPEMITAMASVTDTGYLITILASLFFFLIGGFLLYSALYAAVGASVDEAQDAQQLTTIITFPIIIAFFILMIIMNDPNSPIVFWGSMIPFTSPIVMMGRIPAGIPTWEIIASIAVLYVTFFIVTWGAAKIYKVGIFMHGTKPKIKDLIQWLKY